MKNRKLKPRVLTVVGARPQFIKAAALSRSLRSAQVEEVLVHTGQHYDDNMSGSFFRELELPIPNLNLGVGSSSHAQQTARMLSGLEEVMIKTSPGFVIVFGDTNSTLAAALAAAKLHIPLAHVEAGLRSFNRRMPEEINRRVADELSQVLFCSSTTGMANLAKEGIMEGKPIPKAGRHLDIDEQEAWLVGDIMLDTLRWLRDNLTTDPTNENETLRSPFSDYGVVTCHREENTDDPKRFERLVRTLREISTDLPLVWPMHPRCRSLVQCLPEDLSQLGRIRIMDPLGYVEMARLCRSAKVILTDSGGLQKEAYFHRVPCLTLRNETEWTETIELQSNQLVGTDPDRIKEGFAGLGRLTPNWDAQPYGDGRSAERIVSILQSFL